jgi:hypothetical protein
LDCFVIAIEASAMIPPAKESSKSTDIFFHCLRTDLRRSAPVVVVRWRNERDRADHNAHKKCDIHENVVCEVLLETIPCTHRHRQGTHRQSEQHPPHCEELPVIIFGARHPHAAEISVVQVAWGQLGCVQGGALGPVGAAPGITCWVLEYSGPRAAQVFAIRVVVHVGCKYGRELGERYEIVVIGSLS